MPGIWPVTDVVQPGGRVVAESLQELLVAPPAGEGLDERHPARQHHGQSGGERNHRPDANDSGRRRRSTAQRQRCCDPMRNARLNLLEAFSQAITSVKATMASSSKNGRRRSKRSSSTSWSESVMASAYSSATR